MQMREVQLLGRRGGFGLSSTGLDSVLSFSEWSASEVEWQSPLALNLSGKSSGSEQLSWSQRMAKASGKPVPLLQFMAMHGFAEVPAYMLDRIARVEFDLKLPADLPAKVFQLIKLVLRCEDREACAYLECRVVAQTCILSDRPWHAVAHVEGVIYVVGRWRMHDHGSATLSLTNT